MNTLKLLTLLSILFSVSLALAIKPNKPLGLANLASIHCEESGGKLELVGSIGICKFESPKSACEERDFMWGNCHIGQCKEIKIENEKHFCIKN